VKVLELSSSTAAKSLKNKNKKNDSGGNPIKILVLKTKTAHYLQIGLSYKNQEI
jgi:hypothetical protein